MTLLETNMKSKKEISYNYNAYSNNVVRSKTRIEANKLIKSDHIKN